MEQVTPLLRELREGGLVANMEALTRTAADAVADVQKLQSAVLTEDNVKALRQVGAGRGAKGQAGGRGH